MRVRVRETRAGGSTGAATTRITGSEDREDYDEDKDEADDIPQFRAGVLYIIPMVR